MLVVYVDFERHQVFFGVDEAYDYFMTELVEEEADTFEEYLEDYEDTTPLELSEEELAEAQEEYETYVDSCFDEYIDGLESFTRKYM